MSPPDGVLYVAEMARLALDDLREPQPWSPDQLRCWHWRDDASFRFWQELERGIPYAQGHNDHAEQTLLHQLLNTMHTAFPYDESERQWLHESFWSLDFGRRGWVAAMRSQEAIIVSAGLQRAVYGRDLLRRWWAWRRETDEFSGQRTRALAVLALHGLVEAFHPNPDVRDRSRASCCEGGS